MIHISCDGCHKEMENFRNTKDPGKASAIEIVTDAVSDNYTGQKVFIKIIVSEGHLCLKCILHQIANNHYFKPRGA